MGTKRPDVLRHPPGPEQALTLAEMHLAEWQLMACCRRCGVRLRVSLPLLIKAHGPDAVWWGRKGACTVWGCDGQIGYQARSIVGGTWRSMQEPAPARLVDRLTARRSRLDRGPR